MSFSAFARVLITLIVVLLCNVSHAGSGRSTASCHAVASDAFRAFLAASAQ